MYTDSRCLFDVINKCSQTQVRSLKIDLQAWRNLYKSYEISNVDFIRGPCNPTDGMIKPFRIDPPNDF